MRALLTAAGLSMVFTAVAALALNAADAVLAVAAIAVAAVLISWVSLWHSDEETSGLAISGAAPALTLSVIGRHHASTLFPLLVAQLLGAAIVGALVALSAGALGEPLVWSEPSIAVIAVVMLLVGLLGSWATTALDGGAGTMFAGVTPLIAGAVLPVVFAGAAQPAAAIGLAVAGLLTWPAALVAAVATGAGALLGAYALAGLTPAED